MRRIAALSQTFDVLYLHCPLGPIALAASLQIACCVPLPHQEQSIGIHYNRGRMSSTASSTRTCSPSPTVFLARPTAPRLGITVDERAVRDADESVPTGGPRV